VIRVRLWLALIAAAVLALVVALLRYGAPVPRDTIRVGTRTLTSCGPADGLAVWGYCGVMRVPLDWNDPRAGTIDVRFQWYPADEPTTQTIVAQEGGPGFPSTGGGWAYVKLFDPLLNHRNLLMMDERGTGGSTPIDCEPLQHLNLTESNDEEQRAIEACAAQLNSTFLMKNGGGYAHASELFATPQSVRDLAAIVRALRLRPVDLYGESYGTFFAQAFASNHPELVRSVVLDGAYPLDQDFFDAPARDEICFAYDTVCARSIACRAAAPGSSIARLRRLAQRLARTPLKSADRTYDARALATLLQAGSLDGPAVEYRNLDAAARAWLDHDDAVPLVRLFAWSQRLNKAPSSYTAYSAGMEVAAECVVYRSPFDLRAPYDERLRQYRAAVAALPASLFDPVSSGDALKAPDETFDQCLRWPAPLHRDPVVRRSPPLLAPNVPALVISGELDSTTPPGDARLARARLGPSARLVSIPNSGHVPSIYDPSDCAQRIVLAFIDSPRKPLDTSCVAHIPEVRAVGVFPLTLADQPRASARHGDRANDQEARLAALAVETVADALQAARVLAYDDPTCGEGYCGSGLRGGRFVGSRNLLDVALFDAAYSRDAAVSGTVSVARAAFPTAIGLVSGRINVRLNDGTLSEDLSVRWDERQPRAFATIDGRANSGHTIHETVPAP
jgi:pimeloyl-ACP methyl ester carboxylesterase